MKFAYILFLFIINLIILSCTLQVDQTVNKESSKNKPNTIFSTSIKTGVSIK